MTIEIPDEQVPEDLTEKAVRALVAYMTLDAPGSKMEIERGGDGAHHVRVYEGTRHYERAED